MKIYIAHTITASQGGSVIGVYPTRKRAKADLLRMGMPNEGTDWTHFIRVGTLGKLFGHPLSLPRTRNFK